APTLPFALVLVDQEKKQGTFQRRRKTDQQRQPVQMIILQRDDEEQSDRQRELCELPSEKTSDARDQAFFRISRKAECKERIRQGRCRPAKQRRSARVQASLSSSRSGPRKRREQRRGKGGGNLQADDFV